MKRIAVILDMDGTIIESGEAKHCVLLDLFASEPAAVRREIDRYNRAHGGVPRRLKFEHIARHVATLPASRDVPGLLDRYAAALGRSVAASPLVRGVERLFADDHILRFLCSAAPEAEVAEVLRHHGLADRVAGVYGAPVTKVEALRTIRAEQGNACVFIGDAAADARAAAIAGMPFVLRLSGEPPPALDAVRRIADFTDYQDWLFGIVGE
ncbi:MAG: haloacid dehalogenase-like hydrolase [Sphingobium sp.]